MKDLLDIIVRALVEDEESVSIDEEVDGSERILRLSVAPEDRGAVIGRQGRTIRAIETVLLAASKDDRHVVLEVMD